MSDEKRKQIQFLGGLTEKGLIKTIRDVNSILKKLPDEEIAKMDTDQILNVYSAAIRSFLNARN